MWKRRGGEVSVVKTDAFILNSPYQSWDSLGFSRMISKRVLVYLKQSQSINVLCLLKYILELLIITLHPLHRHINEVIRLKVPLLLTPPFLPLLLTLTPLLPSNLLLLLLPLIILRVTLVIILILYHYELYLLQFSSPLLFLLNLVGGVCDQVGQSLIEQLLVLHLLGDSELSDDAEYHHEY